MHAYKRALDRTELYIFWGGQECFKNFCEDESWVADRRKILRVRAGLKDSDRKLVA